MHCAVSHEAYNASSAIQFIIQNEQTREFSVHPDGARFLETLEKQPLVVVAVAGLWRTGKSTLLNCIQELMQRDGNRKVYAQHGARRPFSVGSAISACTKGIWMFPVRVPSGRMVLLLDSEGLGSTDEDETFDMQIVTLTILLASVFCLNTVGPISENALDQLDFVVNLVNSIRAQEIGEEGGKGGDKNADSKLVTLSEYFPMLIWICRDFALKLQNNKNEAITPSQYLEQSLETQSKHKGAAEKNRIRQVLREAFRLRDCLCLVRPVIAEGDLQRLEEMSLSDMRPEFADGLKKLLEKIVNAPVKSVEGTIVDGAALASLANVYCHALNTGAVPVIHGAWHSAVESLGNAAVDNAVSQFESKLNSIAADSNEQALEEAELNMAISNAKTTAHNQVSVSCRNYGPIEAAMLIKLNERIAPIQRRAQERNAAHSIEHCKRAIKLVWQQLNIEDKFRNLDRHQLWKVFDELRDLYDHKAKGHAKLAVFLEFVNIKLLEMCSSVAVDLRNMSASLRELQTQMQSLHDNRDRLQQKLEQKEKMLNNAVTTKDTLNVQLRDVQNEHHKLQLLNQNVSSKLEQLQKEALASKSASEEHKQTIAQLQAEFKNLQLLKESLSSKLEQSQKEAAASKSSNEEHKQTIARLQTELKNVQLLKESLSSKFEQSQTQVTSLNLHVSHQNQIMEEQQKSFERVSRERDMLRDRQDNLSSEVEKLQKALLVVEADRRPASDRHFSDAGDSLMSDESFEEARPLNDDEKEAARQAMGITQPIRDPNKMTIDALKVG